jgi:ribosome-binding factor A
MTKPNHSRKSGASQRMLRVGELVRHAMVEIFIHEGVHDPVLAGHTITFAEVKMTADLRHATVYVMPLGGKDTEPVIDALNKNKKWLRGTLAKRVEMRYVPELHFRIDERFDEGDRIGRLLRSPEVARDLGKDKSRDKSKDTPE